MYSTHHRRGFGGGAPAAGGYGGLGAKPLGDFCKFLEKKLFRYHWITFRMCSQPFETTRFLILKAN